MEKLFFNQYLIEWIKSFGKMQSIINFIIDCIFFQFDEIENLLGFFCYLYKIVSFNNLFKMRLFVFFSVFLFLLACSETNSVSQNTETVQTTPTPTTQTIPKGTGQNTPKIATQKKMRNSRRVTGRK